MNNQAADTATDQKQAKQEETRKEVEANLERLLNLRDQGHQVDPQDIENTKQALAWSNSIILFTDDIDPLALTADQINDILVNFTGDENVI